MSGYTQTNTEVLYSNYAAATVTTPTASAVSLIVTYPPIIIPAGYFSKLGAQSSSLRFKSGGLITATATVPTYIFGLYLATTSTFATTINLAATTTFNPSAAQTNVPYWWEVEIGARTLGLGAASTVAAFGDITSAAFASPFFQSLPTSGAYTAVTVSNDVQYYLFPALTLGAATAGNTVTTEFVKLYGEN